ncbi:GntR family transcriptional regulator [Ruegeria arenilitoris]|uniref:GntR family transcriptional regulator n=1 Tax=Ruegeria arenilitoris TaxID=1173585 RepID=UPI00147BC1D4|nr:GntR family transcriptional regulator [Ruegeria arenilitoris]
MSAKRAIHRQSLPDVIASDLRERILRGELVEGETIRQEALADEYDVSRMPVREALKQLDAEGLVQLENNRGATVTEHSLDEISEIFDLRALIEVDLFRRAIPAMTAAQLQKCQGILDQMELSYDVNDVSQWGMLNQRFHASLYAAAGRSLTNDLLHKVSLLSDRYIRMHLSVMKKRKRARKEHRELLELAKAGQVDAACGLLAQHIGRTKKQLVALIADRRTDRL